MTVPMEIDVVNCEQSFNCPESGFASFRSFFSDHTQRRAGILAPVTDHIRGTPDRWAIRAQNQEGRIEAVFLMFFIRSIMAFSLLSDSLNAS
jgi:hypothetical protein